MLWGLPEDPTVTLVRKAILRQSADNTHAIPRAFP
jgi:hypothetical protein